MQCQHLFLALVGNSLPCLHCHQLMSFPVVMEKQINLISMFSEHTVLLVLIHSLNTLFSTVVQICLQALIRHILNF